MKLVSLVRIIWRFNGTDEGSTTNFTTALNDAIDRPNRTVHVLCDGTLSGQVSYLTIDFFMITPSPVVTFIVTGVLTLPSKI